jgi:ankyrin repeat protein
MMASRSMRQFYPGSRWLDRKIASRLAGMTAGPTFDIIYLKEFETGLDMEFTHLPFRAPLDQYRKQADELLHSLRSGDSQAIRLFNQKHPRFLDSKIAWLPRNVDDSEIQNAGLDLADAQLAVARMYDFREWESLAEYVEAVAQTDSRVFLFESGVEAVINGDAEGLKALLREHPELIRARSTRVTCFDPPMHCATLLHYVAANGVEGYRQKSPANAVEMAKILLEAGAEVDALADMYGGKCTTMSMLASSHHPAKAGVQVGLIDTLIDFGAAVEARGSGNWTSPVMTALVFGFVPAAETLVRRGAKVDYLGAAAGLGRTDDARRLLSGSNAEDRHRALALAAQLGHVEIVKVLLDACEDPNRYNPAGGHAHTTPLHQAVWSNHDAVVRLLVERGASLEIKDTIYHSTPLGWAEYGGRKEIAEYLRAHGAKL